MKQLWDTHNFVANATLGGTTGVQAEQGLDNTELEANTSNIQYSNSSHNAASKTLATLGSGNINIADKASSSDLDRLNRDTTTTSKELWDVDQQEGNIDLTVDHRMLSDEGRKEIKDQIGRFDSNLQTVAQNVPSATGGNAVENAIGGFLNKAGDWTLGVVPSEKNAGGLVAQVPILFGGEDRKMGAVQIRPVNDEHVLNNAGAYMPASELSFYQDLDPQGQAAFDGVVISRDFVMNRPQQCDLSKSYQWYAQYSPSGPCKRYGANWVANSDFKV